MEPSDRKARLSKEDSELSLLEVGGPLSKDDSEPSLLDDIAPLSKEDSEEPRLDDEDGLRDAEELRREAVEVMRSSSSEVLSERLL